MSEIFNKTIKKIGIIYRQNLDLSKEIDLILKSIKSFNIDYEISPNLYDDLGMDIFKSSDIIVSLGGDGNLISLCRKASRYNVPVIGVYAGNLGFLTEIMVDEFDEFLKNIIRKKVYIKKLYMLQILIYKNGTVKQKLAFNDVVLSRKNTSMAKIEASIEDNVFNIYHADGLIVSTPAGSTAYNMSAGGSIVYPLAKVFLLTPICSHSLNQRPIILPTDFFVKLKTNDCSLSIDGQEFFDDFDYIEVGLSDKYASLLTDNKKDYFQILKEKLHWGDNN